MLLLYFNSAARAMLVVLADYDDKFPVTCVKATEIEYNYSVNKWECPSQIVARCRPPIRSMREIAKYDNNMSFDFIPSMISRKVRKNDSRETGFNCNVCNDTTSNCSACDCTDCESSTDDSRSTSLLNDHSISHDAVPKISSRSLSSDETRKDNSDVKEDRNNVKDIEEIINESTQVSMIILLGNETNTVTCLAHLLGSISSKALGGDNYLTLNARNIGNDHGEIIDKLKAEIRINRVVIVEDLLTISSEAIKVFHSLCDKENPLISKAIYIITVVSNGYEGSHGDKFVEDRLTTEFSKAIDLDILNPLITRIMDGPIISVLPESSMKEKKTVNECLFF
ncbi:hypothetical protein KPH14_011184 [Odynerus spinipes]|uniref:Uncharacterized protein n=1 Tax=Odynerus spinipes TaxID=1348599 RepID=A0AAD9VI31_9HYME|nr:hypothetical protein KPH14_011184 [Odynerus spinipes]